MATTASRDAPAGNSTVGMGGLLSSLGNTDVVTGDELGRELVEDVARVAQARQEHERRALASDRGPRSRPGRGGTTSE